jgi:hypothetical protein
VGYIKVDIKAQRKSGKDAWSERAQEDVLEGAFEDLSQMWGNNVPYHCIRWFKDDGLVTWCAPASSPATHAAAAHPPQLPAAP